jgi:hypothetical protein
MTEADDQLGGPGAMADLGSVIVTRTPRPLWLAAGAVVLGFVMAAAFLLITKTVIFKWSTYELDPGPGHPFGMSTEAAYAGAFAIGLVIASLLIWAAVKLVDEEGDDALTPLRKRLCGDWNVSATTADGAPEWHGVASFFIEPDLRKLAISMKLPQTEEHHGLDLQILDISLNPRVQPYTLNYYVQFELATLGSQTTKSRQDHQYIFVTTKYQFSQNTELLQGSWYELSGLTTGMIKFERRIGTLASSA